jgi:uncharacterized protein (TIGR03067 family)
MIAAIFGLAAVPSYSAPPPKPPADAAAELKKLNGRWEQVDAEDGDGLGKKHGYSKITLIFKDDQLSSEDSKGMVEEWGSFKIDPDKTPKHIDFKTPGGPRKGKDLSRLGIYQIDDGKLKICFSSVDPPREELRPITFDAPKAGTGHILVVFERKKD